MKTKSSIYKQVVGLTALLALFALPAAATTRNVPSQYSTVQAAINAAASGDTILIASGTYTGPFTVASSKTKITIQGASSTGTILTAGQNQVTLTVSATDVTIDNITVRNTYTGDNNTSQVLIITAARCAIRSSNLLGRQDVLFAEGANTSVYVTGSTIQGTVDFVYGQGRIFVTGSTIREIRGNGATIGAPATAQGQNYGIVFSSCTITSGGTATSDSSYLGRPWGAYGELAFINCSIGSVIEPVGYINWSGTSNSSTCRFAEYPCPSTRASWVTHLTSSQAAAYTKSNVLGGWNPS